MTAPQTSVSSMARGFAGLVSDSSRDSNVRSYVSEEASAEIPFGTFVKQGAADNGALKMTAQTDATIIGLVVHSHAYAKDTELGDTGLKPGVTLSVLTRGRAFVLCEQAVTPATPVFIRGVAAGAEVAGSVRSDADVNDAVDASAWARFLETTTGAGFAEIEFDVNNRLA